MSGLMSYLMLRSCAHSLRSVDGLKHSKTWKSCSTSLLQWHLARSLHVDSPPHKPTLTTSYVHGTSTIPLLPLTVGQSLDNTVHHCVSKVVGVKDERLGEQVCACIRLKVGHTSSTEEIRAFCKGQISHFKILHYVIFVDSYPLTVSGKVMKSILKQDMEKKLGLDS